MSLPIGLLTPVFPQGTRLFLTTFLADGINLGLTKMAEACPGSTKSSLEDIQACYIRDEIYSAALAELVNAQGEGPSGILGRRDHIIIRWTEFQNRQFRSLCRAD